MNPVRLPAWFLVLAITFGAALAPRPAAADAVTDWDATIQSLIVAKGAQGAAYYALVHIAMYDAVNAIDGRYSVYAVKPTSPTRGASMEAAAAAAAYRVLLGVWPDQQPTLDAAYATSMNAIPAGVAKSRGTAVGEEVAAAWLALRANDGREANVPYVFGSGPGVYQRTLPGPPSPLTPWLARMKPFALTSPSQFRAYGPPDVTSVRFAEDLDLTKRLGSATSTERTAEETELALFYTENPNTFWGHNMRELAAQKHLGIAANARLFAMLSIAFSDGAIACWDSKYYFNFWRPVTAIQAADTDGNPYTEADPTWASLAATPPHPEYPAAHACVSAAYGELLEDFFGTSRVKFTLTSTVPNTVPHVFYNTNDLIEEVKMARVYGGMHFHTSTEHGAKIGRQVGHWVTRNYFKPVHRSK
jgi:hypothetical protein